MHGLIVRAKRVRMMAAIDRYLEDILNAITGEQLRLAILNSLTEINRIVGDDDG